MINIQKISKIINGNIEGNNQLSIKGICDIQNSHQNYITYISSSKYEKYFHNSKASAFIVNQNFKLNVKDKTIIRVNRPDLSFIKVIDLFYPKQNSNNNIHPSAIISKKSSLGKNINIGPYSVIESNVTIKDNVYIQSNTYIGKNAIIGENSIINSNVTIYHDVNIGKNCLLDAGTVVGADGFGLVTDDLGRHHKMPHIGKVIINDNVWIGANCCIDRGTLSNTEIGIGTKLDNLIQIAHNVKIGSNCRISGQTAIAGSTIIEDNVTIAGQVGIIDHLTIGKNSIIASKTAVFESLRTNSFVSGIPARPHKNRLRQEVIIKQLPEILIRLRELEKKSSTC